MAASSVGSLRADGSGIANSWRADFPLLRNSRVVYLDSAASAQKPDPVLEAMERFYGRSYANVHRGLYALSQEATAQYEAARASVATFLNAASEREIIFTRGATEAVNLVAYSYARRFLREGDEILITVLEHHSNFVPWQLAADAIGAKLRVSLLGVDEDFSLADFRANLNERTKLVCITQLANALGVELPVAQLVREAHSFGAVVLVDGAQAIVHRAVDVRKLDADFYTFSGHKLYGPTGTGVLYGREELLEEMPPFLGGGDMIRSVTIERTEYNDLPLKFEAGTPNIAGIIGLASAIGYLNSIGIAAVERHEERLVRLLESVLAKVEGIRILGPVGRHHGIVCFLSDAAHPHDLAQFLDAQQIAVRAGHHCAQPLQHALGVHASVRASLGLYSTAEDIEALGEGLAKAQRFFRR